MKVNDMIRLRTDCGTVVYFSEDAVRNLLRDEYKQCAGLIKKATKIDGIVKIEESVESAIRKLKGGEK